MNSKLIIIFLIVLFANCTLSSKEEKLVKYLTNDSCKYWYAYLKDPAKSYGIGYCIHYDGIFQVYVINDSMERIISDMPMRPKSKWMLLNDSTIEFGEGIKCKILFLDEKKLIMQNVRLELQDTLKLYRDKDQETVPILYPIKDTTKNKFSLPAM